MEHYRIVVKDLCANEVEDIIDGNMGTKCEWLDGSDDTGNTYVISAMDEEERSRIEVNDQSQTLVIVDVPSI